MIIKDKRWSWSRCEKVITKLPATYNQTSHWWQETGRHGSYGALSLLLFASVARKPCLRDYHWKYVWFLSHNFQTLCNSRRCPREHAESLLTQQLSTGLHKDLKTWMKTVVHDLLYSWSRLHKIFSFASVYTLELPLLRNLVIFIGVLKVETFIE